MDLLKGLLINLLVILLVLLFTSILLWNRQKLLKFEYQRIHIFIISSSLILLCLFLSIPANEHFIYDLRYIPFILGALYGGGKVTIALSLLLILLRVPIGGDGSWVTIVMVLVGLLLFLYVQPLFSAKSTNWRLLFTTTLAFIMSIFAYLIPSLIYGFHNLIDFFIYSFILTSSTFFVTTLTEILRTTYILHLEAMKYEKMEIVSHLAASISHEIRNPLTAVNGFLQLLLEHKDIPKDCKTYAALALDETNRASNIINDYLTFAKPHPEKQYLFEIGEEINKCKDIIKPLALKTNVHLKSVFFHHGKIKGDPHKFRQVLLNICKNSIEAMPKGGTLSIVTSCNESQIHIHITDTGHGMSPEQVARLGEPYFSLKEQKGTGLGMMVVFRIVEGMGGKVKITSEEMIGTSITLSLPKMIEAKNIEKNAVGQ